MLGKSRRFVLHNDAKLDVSLNNPLEYCWKMLDCIDAHNMDTIGDATQVFDCLPCQGYTFSGWVGRFADSIINVIRQVNPWHFVFHYVGALVGCQREDAT